MRVGTGVDLNEGSHRYRDAAYSKIPRAFGGMNGVCLGVEPGRWRPENDPQVLDALQALYSGALRERWAAGCERLHEEFFESLARGDPAARPRPLGCR